MFIVLLAQSKTQEFYFVQNEIDIVHHQLLLKHGDVMNLKIDNLHYLMRKGGQRMITLTIVKQVKSGKVISYKREMLKFHSIDKARKEIVPIVREMKSAKSQKRTPTIKIDAVSYDTKSEKSLLLELHAITSIDNESDDDY